MMISFSFYVFFFVCLPSVLIFYKKGFCGYDVNLIILHCLKYVSDEFSPFHKFHIHLWQFVWCVAQKDVC